jgi:hypothetical protein
VPEKVGKNTRNGAVKRNLPIAEASPFQTPWEKLLHRLSAT